MAEYVPIRVGSVEEARRIGREIVAALYKDKDGNLVRDRRTEQDVSDSWESVEAVVRQYGGSTTITDPDIIFRIGGNVFSHEGVLYLKKPKGIYRVWNLHYYQFIAGIRPWITFD